jgi:predicted RNA polymerase sigma factor
MLQPPKSLPEARLAMSSPDQKKRNVRLALVLASIAVIFFVGFMAKAALLGI